MLRLGISRKEFLALFKQLLIRGIIAHIVGYAEIRRGGTILVRIHVEKASANCSVLK